MDLWARTRAAVRRLCTSRALRFLPFSRHDSRRGGSSAKVMKRRVRCLRAPKPMNPSVCARELSGSDRHLVAATLWRCAEWEDLCLAFAGIRVGYKRNGTAARSRTQNDWRNMHAFFATSGIGMFWTFMDQPHGLPDGELCRGGGIREFS